MALFGKKTDQDEKKETAKAADVKVAKAVPTVLVPTILLQPRISEKSAKLSQSGKYVFNVKKAANKVEIKKAVEGAYKVNVVQVNIVNNKGKIRNYGRTSGKTSGFKKAVVTLKSGQKIEMAEAI
jgi:large subunit ribosomal protein L23